MGRGQIPTPPSTPVVARHAVLRTRYVVVVAEPHHGLARTRSGGQLSVPETPLAATWCPASLIRSVSLALARGLSMIVVWAVKGLDFAGRFAAQTVIMTTGWPVGPRPEATIAVLVRSTALEGR